jgi:sialate O-acetylesterase
MRLLRALFLVGLSAGAARADVKPHPIFSDNMVLQQGVELVVWGTADPGERIDLQLKQAGAAATGGEAVADKDGRWSVKLPARKAGTGYTLSVNGNNKTVAFKNVAVGEVWVCSGQSNMQWELWRPNLGEQGKTVPAGAKNPNLRLFTMLRHTAATPQYDFPVVTKPREGTKDGPPATFGRWLECEPAAVQEFSAVAYYFGRDLEKALGVPVGLVVTSWGGMPCEAYTSLEALDAEPALKHYADKARAAAKQFEADKKPVPPNTPTALYNAMTHPLLNFRVRGAIWYQGESNAARAFEYRTLLPAMVTDWRKRFACDLPFMVVQLAPFGNGKGNSGGVTYAELRDAQLHAAKSLPKVGLAVITDSGHETDIHPPQKEAVGSRLALAALGIEYGKKIAYSGPVFKAATFAGNTATLTFDHVGGGLVAKDGELTGFAVSAGDGTFVPAKAEVKGDTVVVTSDTVPAVKAVRYGWVNFATPALNLFNKDGLPATPFRTDDAPYTTGGKK